MMRKGVGILCGLSGDGDAWNRVQCTLRARVDIEPFDLMGVSFRSRSNLVSMPG